MSSEREVHPPNVSPVTGFPTGDGGKPAASVDYHLQKQGYSAQIPTGLHGNTEPDSDADHELLADDVARSADVDVSDELTSSDLTQAHRGVDIARAALENARRRNGEAPPKPGRDARRRLANRRANTRRGGYSSSGPDERDPQLAGNILANLFAERGWDRPVAQARVFSDWSGLVGAEIAAHCSPAALHEGELRIAAESTAWATQLRMMSSSILAKLVGELGPDVVTKLMITGPVGPSWKHGAWSVRGHRGPRDTYG